MKNLFGPDGKGNQALGLIKNLMILGILSLLACIPVVTIGAAFTALNDMALRIARGEEGYLCKDFFRSFRENWKESTAIWMVLLGLALFFSWDLFIMNQIDSPKVMKIVLTVVLVLMALLMTYLFPMIAKFQNTIGGYLKNAMMMTLLNLPKAILMLFFYLLPSVLGGYFYEFLPLAFIFGLSLPAWLSARFVYGKYFLGLEEKICQADAKAGIRMEERRS